jgi:apolipoprotein N-acyltransferase
MVLAGLLQAASLAWPVAMPQALAPLGLAQGAAIWWLQWLAMTALVAAVVGADTTRSAAWLGWLFATAWLTGSFGWLYISMHTYGGLAAPLAALAVLA